jgi:hypothetical protein
MIMIFDKIFRRRKSAFWVCLGLALVFTLSAVPANFSYAQGRFMSEEWKVPNFYPRGFDGYGRIDAISKDRIIISDTGWKFSRHIQFATPRDSHAAISSFSVGDTVAYLLNEKREIISLWYIEFYKR